jgi:paraquat-inducible protein B
MSARTNATAVGAFVLGALLIGVAIAVMFGSGALFRDAKRYVIFFSDSLEGLAVGAPVKYRGVQIGTVVDIEALFQMERGSVDIPVVIELEHDAIEGANTGRKTVDTLVEQGLRARLDIASLITGQQFVELSMFPGTPIRRFPNTTDYHQIPSVPSLQSGLQQTLSDLVAKQPELARGVDQVLELLNYLTADNGAEILAKGVKSMASLATGLSDPTGPMLVSLGQLPALMGDVRQSIAAVPPLLQQASEAMASVDGLVGGAESPVAKSLADLQTILVSTRTSTQQLATLLGQIRGPVTGFAQTGLPELQGLIEDADRAVGEVNRTLRDLRQDPARFIFGSPAADGVKLR